jgi:hypothetical protein
LEKRGLCASPRFLGSTWSCEGLQSDTGNAHTSISHLLLQSEVRASLICISPCGLRPQDRSQLSVGRTALSQSCLDIQEMALVDSVNDSWTCTSSDRTSEGNDVPAPTGGLGSGSLLRVHLVGTYLEREIQKCLLSASPGMSNGYLTQNTSQTSSCSIPHAAPLAALC